MKALIMAAGKGTRISRYIEGKPKCTVDIGGQSLIEYTVKRLLEKGIDSIAIVLGYKSEIIEKILENYEITYYYNYFYDVTNSIASVWFARDFIDEDLIMMNGDVFLEPELIDKIFHIREFPIIFSDSSRKEEADYKLYYEDNQLIKYGKELYGEDISGEYVGIARIDKEFTKDYLLRLFQFIKGGAYEMWWEDVLYSFAGERAVHIKDVKGLFWAEVDFIEDYERILDFRKNGNVKHNR